MRLQVPDAESGSAVGGLMPARHPSTVRGLGAMFARLFRARTDRRGAAQ
jgi:hypothetical protein